MKMSALMEAVGPMLKQHPVLTAKMVALKSSGKIKLGRPNMSAVGSSAPHMTSGDGGTTKSGKKPQTMSASEGFRMFKTGGGKKAPGAVTAEAPQPLKLLSMSGPRRTPPGQGS